MARKVVEKKPKKIVKTTSGKLGRNSDGTFAKGNQISVGNNGGRPQDRFSHRAIAAQRAMKDPSRITKDLEILDSIIDSETASPAEKVKAIETKAKLFGGFDVQETKTTLEGHLQTTQTNSPFNQLTKQDLLKLLKRKK
jgi:hypothetical protein